MASYKQNIVENQGKCYIDIKRIISGNLQLSSDIFFIANMDLVNSLNVKTTLSHIIAQNRQSTSHRDSKFIDGT